MTKNLFLFITLFVTLQHCTHATKRASHSTQYKIQQSLSFLPLPPTNCFNTYFLWCNDSKILLCLPTCYTGLPIICVWSVSPTHWPLLKNFIQYTKPSRWNAPPPFYYAPPFAAPKSRCTTTYPLNLHNFGIEIKRDSSTIHDHSTQHGIKVWSDILISFIIRILVQTCTFESLGKLWKGYIYMLLPRAVTDSHATW